MKTISVITTILAVIIGGHSFGQISTVDLEAHFNFNGNTNDSTGNGNDGTNLGVTYTTDRFGAPMSSGQFNGGEYIEISNDFDYQERTISLWFYADTITSTDGVIYNSDNAGLVYGSTIIMVSENAGQNSIRFSVSSAAAGYIFYEPLTEKEWHHASISAANDSIHYYLDCNKVASYPFSASSSNNGTTTTKIGCGRNYNNFFSGKIDDIRIYSTDVDSNIQLDLCNESQATNSINSNEMMQKTTVHIFPNPTNGIINVEEYKVLTIYNITGVQIASFSQNEQVDISTYSPAVYLVNIDGHYQKIIKK